MPINRPHDFPKKNGLGRRAFAFGRFFAYIRWPRLKAGKIATNEMTGSGFDG